MTQLNRRNLFKGSWRCGSMALAGLATRAGALGAGAAGPVVETRDGKATRDNPWAF